jgi:hypothetical protein
MTEVFRFADRVVEASAESNPINASYAGVAGFDDRLTDFGVAAEDARHAQTLAWLAELDTLPIENDDDRLAVEFIRERLGSQVAVYETGEHLRSVNVIGSPVQYVRNVFTLMPTDTDDDWRTIATRLEAVPWSLGTLRASYAEGVARGVVPARRQVAPARRPGRGSTASSRDTRGATRPWPRDSVRPRPAPRRHTPTWRRGCARSTRPRQRRPTRSDATATWRWPASTWVPASTPRRPTPGAGRSSPRSPGG